MILRKRGKNLVLQFQIAGFFGHQYFWKESIKTLDFLHGDNY